MPYQTDFDLDIPKAIHEQLVEVFENLDTADLLRIEPAGPLPVTSHRGVYGLFVDQALMYVGKASNLARRLGEHRVKLSGRHNVGDIRFKAVFVHKNWNAYAPESILLDHYRLLGLCAWNGSGLGPNDPGRNREETDLPPDGFHARYPIRQDWACDWLEAQEYEVLELLVSLKEKLPFLLRYEVTTHYRTGHPDFEGKRVVLPSHGMGASEILELVVGQLPGWQATAFPSHIILYREARDYAYGEVIGRGPIV